MPRVTNINIFLFNDTSTRPLEFISNRNKCGTVTVFICQHRKGHKTNYNMFQLIIIISIICIFGYSAITTESIDIYGSLKYGTLGPNLIKVAF
jgi:hypothetical protein